MTEVIVLAVDEQTREVRDDDRVLLRALATRGAAVVPVLWGEPLPASATGILIRSTWDYIDRLDEFLAWLDELDEAGLPTWNGTGLLRWNVHKGYLAELADGGVPVIPTEVVLRGGAGDLSELMARRGWADVVVKPAVGAGSKLAVHVGREGLGPAQRHLDEVVRDHDVLVQPYLAEIEDAGELSIVVVGSAITHVVRKQPQPGEWRIQSDYGGSAVREEPTRAHRALADQVLALLPEVPRYARIDVVEVGGELLLMEVELIEPELWFGLAPWCADALAAALVP